MPNNQNLLETLREIDPYNTKKYPVAWTAIFAGLAYGYVELGRRVRRNKKELANRQKNY